MVRVLAYAFFGLIWFCLVFLGTFWMTFPTDAFISRGQAVVSDLTGGTMTFTASSVSPWWSGLKVNDLKLYSIDPDGEEPQQTLIEADVLRVKVGILETISGNPPFSGRLDLAGGQLDYEGQLTGMWDGQPTLENISITGDEVPVKTLSTVLSPLIGDVLVGSGALAVQVRLDIQEGIGKANGKLSLKGDDLSLTLNLPDFLSGGDEVYELGPISVDTLDLQLDAKDGKAKVSKGRLRSDYIKAQVDGDIVLNDDLSRTRLRLKLIFEDLGEDLALVQGFMSKAKWDDEKYHYNVSCAVNRLTARCFRPDRQRRSRNRSSSRRSRSDRDEPSNEDLEEARDEREKRRRGANRRRRASDRERGPGNLLRPSDRDRELDDEEPLLDDGPDDMEEGDDGLPMDELEMDDGLPRDSQGHVPPDAPDLPPLDLENPSFEE